MKYGSKINVDLKNQRIFQYRRIENSTNFQ